MSRLKSFAASASIALMLLLYGVAGAQTAPTVTLSGTCTAPCNAPAAITLSAITAVASGRTVSKVEFYEGTVLLATDTTSPYSSARTAVAGGSHSYIAKVYDNAAPPLSATSAAIIVAVNTAPTETLTAACTAPCIAPATVLLTATPIDTDGSITKVEFYRGTTLINTKTAAPWTYIDAALAVGGYSYTAKAFDNATTPLTVTSAAQSVTVTVAPPTTTLTASCAAHCNAPAAITLSATATVAAGRAVSKIEFYEGTVLLATDTTSPYSSARTAVTGGSHIDPAKISMN